MNIQRIRDLREDSDYTQEYIAKLLNVNQRTYSRYENGEHAIPLTILSFLADIQKRACEKTRVFSFVLLLIVIIIAILHKKGYSSPYPIRMIL